MSDSDTENENAQDKVTNIINNITNIYTKCSQPTNSVPLLDTSKRNSSSLELHGNISAAGISASANDGAAPTTNFNNRDINARAGDSVEKESGCSCSNGETPQPSKSTPRKRKNDDEISDDGRSIHQPSNLSDVSHCTPVKKQQRITAAVKALDHLPGTNPALSLPLDSNAANGHDLSHCSITTITTIGEEDVPTKKRKVKSSEKVLPKDKKTTESKGKKRKAAKKSSPSTFKEFKQYAEKESKCRACPKSSKPHLIMESIEKYLYHKEAANASKQRSRFFTQMEFQSQPSSKEFEKLASHSLEKKNPLRTALFYAASAFKEVKENSIVGSRSDKVADIIYEIFKLVLKLTNSAEKAEEVLNKDLLHAGAHATDVAHFLLPIMVKLYDMGCADDKGDKASHNKAYAIKWIIAGYQQSKKYSAAINFIQRKESDYQGIENESTVGIFKTLGLCYEQVKKFDEALVALQKAKSMLVDGNVMKEKSKKEIEYRFICIAIERIKKRS